MTGDPIGRGVLSALGIGGELAPGEVVARGATGADASRREG